MSLNTRKRHTLYYKIGNFFAAVVSWLLFFYYRKAFIEGMPDLELMFKDKNLYLGLILVPIGWHILYEIFDNYKDIYRLSRVATLVNTISLTTLGVLVLFFSILIDDVADTYTSYVNSFITLWLLHFSCTFFVRMYFLTRASHRIKKGQIAYRTLIIGGNDSAVELYKEIEGRAYKLGNQFIGFINVNGKDFLLNEHLPHLGSTENLEEIVKKYQVEEAIIAVESSDHKNVKQILDVLYNFRTHLLVKIIPDIYDIMLGVVKMNHVYGAVLIEIEQDLMNRWESVVKRGLDIVVSLVSMLLLSPLYIYAAIRVRLSSKGPIIYQQERIGKNGKPFMIYKFRSMFVDAEANGPQLSNDDDIRCTVWGKVMRKWRVDEIPQFWNVFKGDMSLVGPRPERQFFIDQLLAKAPHYKHLLKIRPGLTSWGQVKYGYASNLSEMLQRLKFDILYIENMSLSLDFKILAYTLLVIIKGEGK